MTPTAGGLAVPASDDAREDSAMFTVALMRSNWRKFSFLACSGVGSLYKRIRGPSTDAKRLSRRFDPLPKPADRLHSAHFPELGFGVSIKVTSLIIWLGRCACATHVKNAAGRCCRSVAAYFCGVIRLQRQLLPVLYWEHFAEGAASRS